MARKFLRRSALFIMFLLIVWNIAGMFFEVHASYGNFYSWSRAGSFWCHWNPASHYDAAIAVSRRTTTFTSYFQGVRGKLSLNDAYLNLPGWLFLTCGASLTTAIFYLTRQRTSRRGFPLDNVVARIVGRLQRARSKAPRWA